MTETPQAPGPLTALGAAFGVLLGQPCGRVLHVNAAFCRLSGFVEAHLRAHGCPWLQPAAWAPDSATPHDLLAAQGVELTALAWPEPPGATLLLARAPAAATTEHAALLRLRTMLQGAMHELKTPLTGVVMGLDYLRRQVGQSPHATRVIDEARRQLHSLNATLDQLVRLTRPLDLRPRQADVAVALAPLFSAQSHFWGAIQFSPPAERCSAWVDPAALCELCGHLLDNAAEATDRAHSIVVAIGCDATHAHLSIADRGAGLTAEAAVQAFDPFFSTKHRHLGLGLTHAQRIARAHGGQLRLRAGTTGTGTVAEVALPRRLAQPDGAGCA